MNTRQVRQTFLDFFAEKGHQIVPSAPVVNKDDPTLLFVNAGMNPFKDIFTGHKPATHLRVADTQKCLRVSGKHNDLEEVGHDTYHHTLFEMLGNWSFGDYFREEAIAWAWELLTERYKLNPEHLYVTVFGGDAKENVPEDVESAACWARFLPQDHILRFGKKDNFWEMGDTGPCGPCTEIHIDLRSAEDRARQPGRELVNLGHPQVIEIWNLVLIQFNRKASGELEPLKMKSVDTGMGLERLAMALQGVQSTYDTDGFTPLKDFLARTYGAVYGQSEERDIAIRVILDHIRAISFTMADGQLPGNGGAGYVVRRLIRRASRYGFRFLGIAQPFLHRLVNVLATIYDGVFPELVAQQTFIAQVLEQEEKSFLRTLERGQQLIDAAITELRQTKQNTLTGAFAFRLYDEFGFPLDLTQVIAREQGLEVDVEGFNALLEQQRARSREAAKQETGDWVELQAGVESQFVGYERTDVATEFIKLRTLTGSKGKTYQVVLSHTPFYAEGGGQVGDTGTLTQGSEVLRVLDTKRENELIVHLVDKLPAAPEGVWQAQVDVPRRDAIRANHTATHLLHAALRRVLGTHVEQRGSYVGPDYLRFDFSHFQKVTDQELAQIEALVNAHIADRVEGNIRAGVPIAEAKAMGAMALFGEKYGDTVRVVQFGPEYSTELCGGTHVQNTLEIRLFKITTETAVAAGVRRIEAVTGSAALQWLEEQNTLLTRVRELLRQPKDVLKAVQGLLEEQKAMAARLELLQTAQLAQLKTELLTQAAEVPGKPYRVLAAEVPPLNADALKSLSFELRKSLTNTVILLGTVNEGKPQLSLILTADLDAEPPFDASKAIRDLARHIQGGGGGQPFYATAGGKDAAGLPAALAAVRGL